MTKIIDLYLNHDLVDRMEWSMTTEEILGSSGRATITVQDRDNLWEPQAHWDVEVRIASNGWVLFRGEIVTDGVKLTVKFPFRKWDITCADYNNQLDQRNVGALDGKTWIDADGLGDFVNVDPYANSLQTDRLTVQQLFDHYIRVDGLPIDADAFVGEYLANFGPVYWLYTNLKAVLEELASFVTQNLQFWVDPDLFFHWTTVPAWQDLAQQAAANVVAGGDGALARLFPELVGCKLYTAPFNLSDDPGPGETSHADLEFTLDGAVMPEQVYVKGATGYVYNNGVDPLAVDPPIGTPSGAYVLTFNGPTTIYPPAGSDVPICWAGHIRPTGAVGYITTVAGTFHTYEKQSNGRYLIVVHTTGGFSAWVGPQSDVTLTSGTMVTVEKILSGTHAGWFVSRFAINPKTHICPTGTEPVTYGSAGLQVYVDAVAVPPNLAGVSGTFWVIRSGDKIGWLVPWIRTTTQWWDDSWGEPPLGAQAHISFNGRFCRYFVSAGDTITSAEEHVTGGFSAYIYKLAERRWPTQNTQRYIGKIMNGGFAGWWVATAQSTAFVKKKDAITTSNITVVIAPGSGGGGADGPSVGIGGSGWANEADQDLSLRQAYLEAPSSTTRAERDAAGGQAIYRGRFPTLRGTAKVRGEDGWRVGQLVKITDERLPASLNARYYVIQRVATSLIPTLDIREYNIDWGDGPVSRHTQKPLPKSPTPPPANRVLIDVFDLAPEPLSSQIITGQLTSPNGTPWAIAGKVVEWSLQVFDKDGNEILGQGSLSPITSLTDKDGKARTTLTTGTTLGLVYYVFADSPVL